MRKDGNKHTLIIEKADADDTGVYTCIYEIDGIEKAYANLTLSGW